MTKYSNKRPNICLMFVNYIEYWRTPGGVLALRLQRHWGSTCGNTGGRMCLQSHLQTSPPTPKKAYAKFQNPRKTF